MIKKALGLDVSSLRGKDKVGGYWASALKKIPDLHFELVEVAEGVDSIALYYQSVMNKMTIEVMFFDQEGKVNKVIAHYT